jgi:UV DNA damage endonuclease
MTEERQQSVTTPPETPLDRPKLRLGLCCLFHKEPVSFRTTTAKTLSALPRNLQLLKLSEICLHNASNLLLALETVQRLGIGAFRIMSPLFPRMTHPEVGYSMEQLPDGETILSTLKTCRSFASKQQIRLSFHPDQFVVLSSPHPAVVANSIQELEYQAWLAEAVGADIINIHAGGVYGDKSAALQRFRKVYDQLSESVRSRLTLENDDVSYTPQDLLLLCEQQNIPLVYDLHHHRCNPDNLTVEEATEQAGNIWKAAGREQYCHISSPQTGWGSSNPKPHADYINPDDFPDCWRARTMTIDIEAKAKELAVLRFMSDLNILNPTH